MNSNQKLTAIHVANAVTKRQVAMITIHYFINLPHLEMIRLSSILSIK